MNIKLHTLTLALLATALSGMAFAQEPQTEPMPAEQNTPATPPATTDTAVLPQASAATGAPVTVVEHKPDSVVGEYKIDFEALDANNDGWLSRNETRANATLSWEFRAVDNDNNGRLSRQELKGWM